MLAASLIKGSQSAARLSMDPLKPVMVDQSPIGATRVSNPPPIPSWQTWWTFLRSDRSRSAAFFFQPSEGACPTCHGLGAVEIVMRYLPPTWGPCGLRRRTLQRAVACCAGNVRKQQLIADFFELTISQAITIFTAEKRLPASSLQAGIFYKRCKIWVGYLRVGAAPSSLFREECAAGEAGALPGKQSSHTPDAHFG
jgi:excinuclease ABC subunit A